MATIYLIEGPVGAGKSTYAAQRSASTHAPRLNLDEWMAVLFRPDRPETGFMDWYAERKDRCIEQIWRVASDLLDTGTDVILELGLVQRSLREAFYSRVDATDYSLEVRVLDAPRELRWERVAHRNQNRGSTFQMEVPAEIFALADGAWQPPDDAECRDRDIRIVTSAEASGAN